MAVTLSPQAVRALGEESLGAADASGNTVPNAPGTFVVATNSSGGDLRLRLLSATRCSLGRLTHSLDYTVGAGLTRYLPLHALDIDPRMRHRWGDGVAIEYPDGVVDLDVAAVRLLGWFGVGADDETPPALGATPGTVPISTKDVAPTFAAAVASGMRIEANDGKTQLWIDNAGPAPRTVYIHASRRCDFGFFDDEVVSIAVGDRYITRELPTGRFGRAVGITYDDPNGLAFAAVRQEAYRG